MTSDFNGDGRDDVLWRNNDGLLTAWLSPPNGDLAAASVVSLGTIPTDWQIIGIGDFNGDRRADLLWRHETGLTTTWLGAVDGSFINNHVNSASQTTDLHVATVGDFNGDGRDDIFWRGDGGRTDLSLGTAAGGFIDGSAYGNLAIPIDWFVSGVGDFDGDGRDDLLWRHGPSAQMTEWLGTADGNFLNIQAAFSPVIPWDWSTIATGDFNGDGADDVLWRHDSGLVTDWLGSRAGGFLNNHANSAMAGPTTYYYLVTTGDFNGDGRDDVLWREDNTVVRWSGTSEGGFTTAGTVTVPHDSWVQPDWVGYW